MEILKKKGNIKNMEIIYSLSWLSYQAIFSRWMTLVGGESYVWRIVQNLQLFCFSLSTYSVKSSCFYWIWKGVSVWNILFYINKKALNVKSSVCVWKISRKCLARGIKFKKKSFSLVIISKSDTVKNLPNFIIYLESIGCIFICLSYANKVDTVLSY